MPNVNGSKWIRRDKRLAIYLRDGMSCVYCGATVEDDSTLSLDHIVPREEGGGNETVNLVTACIQCNSVRGTRTVEDFCTDVAAYLNVNPDDISSYVFSQTHIPIDREEAKRIIARRSTWSDAIRHATKQM